MPGEEDEPHDGGRSSIEPSRSLFGAEDAAIFAAYMAKHPAERIRFRQVKTVTRATVPWKHLPREGSPDMALAEPDIMELAGNYELPAERLRALSVALRSVTAAELALAQPELTPARRKAGLKKLERSIDLISMAQEKLGGASSALEEVWLLSPISLPGTPNPGTACVEELHQARAVLEHCRRVFEALHARGLSTLPGAPDQRKVSDQKRTILCTHIFNLWLELGRPLSFTTDPISNERTGQLINLIQDIARRLTDPPSELDGDAIMRELQAFKSQIV